jgi:hypothetical protein
MKIEDNIDAEPKMRLAAQIPRDIARDRLTQETFMPCKSLPAIVLSQRIQNPKDGSKSMAIALKKTRFRRN